MHRVVVVSVTSSAPGRNDDNFKSVISEHVCEQSISCEIILRWISQSTFGWGKGLVSSGKKALPEPMLTHIYVALWCHQAKMSYHIILGKMAAILQMTYSNTFSLMKMVIFQWKFH